jgi:hypothetical protein
MTKALFATLAFAGAVWFLQVTRQASRELQDESPRSMAAKLGRLAHLSLWSALLAYHLWLVRP